MKKKKKKVCDGDEGVGGKIRRFGGRAFGHAADFSCYMFFMAFVFGVIFLPVFFLLLLFFTSIFFLRSTAFPVFSVDFSFLSLITAEHRAQDRKH